MGLAGSVCPSVLLDQHTHLCLADLLVLLLQILLAPRPPVSAWIMAKVTSASEVTAGRLWGGLPVYASAQVLQINKLTYSVCHVGRNRQLAQELLVLSLLHESASRRQNLPIFGWQA